jgi:hypothetical protein
VDEKETPRDDTRLKLSDESGMTRRDLMRRGAVVGGTLLWVAPAIQSIGSKAYAQVGSPPCAACVEATPIPGGTTLSITLTPSELCCTCIDENSDQPFGAVAAVVACFLAGDCTGVGQIQAFPCA